MKQKYAVIICLFLHIYSVKLQSYIKNGTPNTISAYSRKLVKINDFLNTAQCSSNFVNKHLEKNWQLLGIYTTFLKILCVYNLWRQENLFLNVFCYSHGTINKRLHVQCNL